MCVSAISNSNLTLGMVTIGGVSERVVGESTIVCPIVSNALWVDRFTIFQ